MQLGHKVCTVCGSEKPVEAFPGRRGATCGVCHGRLQRERHGRSAETWCAYLVQQARSNAKRQNGVQHHPRGGLRTLGKARWVVCANGSAHAAPPGLQRHECLHGPQRGLHRLRDRQRAAGVLAHERNEKRPARASAALVGASVSSE